MSDRERGVAHPVAQRAAVKRRACSPGASRSRLLDDRRSSRRVGIEAPGDWLVYRRHYSCVCVNDSDDARQPNVKTGGGRRRFDAHRRSQLDRESRITGPSHRAGRSADPLGFAPSGHLNLGTIMVGSGGTGHATVTVPAYLLGGDYRVIVGGCAPHADLGPLAWDATAIIFVGPPPALTTEPRPGTTWFFAEGSTQLPFETWIPMANPGATGNARVTMTFGLSNGQSVTRSVVVPAAGRASVFINLLVPNQPISSRIDSDLPIVAERSMYSLGGRGGTNTIGTQQ